MPRERATVTIQVIGAPLALEIIHACLADLPHTSIWPHGTQYWVCHAARRAASEFIHLRARRRLSTGSPASRSRGSVARFASARSRLCAHRGRISHSAQSHRQDRTAAAQACSGPCQACRPAQSGGLALVSASGDSASVCRLVSGPSTRVN